MEKSNQQPEPEDCSAKGDSVDLWFYRVERSSRSVSREKHEPQAGPASCLSNSASKGIDASGEAFVTAEPKTDVTDTGEVAEGLPGSKSVARAEGDTSNEGGPEGPCRTNYECQAGKEAQRQGVPPELSGVGLVNSIQGQFRATGTDLGEGANRSTQSAQATSPVRKTDQDWPTFLRAIAEKASTDKHHRFGGLYRWLNEEVLGHCFFLLRKDAASGVDGITFEIYEQDLEKNLKDLVGRLKRKGYRARLVRRKWIPKGNSGKLRPLGIPVLEDKLLQVAVTQILLAIYEIDFLPCSYGYRPGVSAHDALKDLSKELQFGGHNFVVEADIKGFFDNIQWEWLERMLEERIDDGAFLNLIRKWLRAGIMEEDGQVIHPQTGTPQGGVISPVLANIYLHYVLDLWFEKVVKSKQRGRCRLIRYADDFVAAFEYRHEAEAFEKDLKGRLAKFGLEVAADKTKTLRFGRNGGPHNGRFDFLGFEFSWGLDRKGRPNVRRRTATKKHLAVMQRMKDWIKEHRDLKLKRLLGTLKAKLQGTWNYYGLIGNSRRMRLAYDAVCRALFKWLNRRSQRCSLDWAAFNRLLKRFQIPRPRVVERDAREMPCQMEMSFCQRMVDIILRSVFRRAHARAS
jgi:group II intron reverse transcriptase/maturase